MPPTLPGLNLLINIESVFQNLESSRDPVNIRLWQNSGPQLNHYIVVCVRDGVRCAYFYDRENQFLKAPANFPDSLEFISQPQNHHHHHVRCRAMDFHDHFNHIISDWVLRADQYAHPVDALESVIADWAEFLNQSSGMDRARLIGLFGELDFFDKALCDADAVAQWLGCQKGTIDFRNGNKAVEVKASTARDSHKVTFHGLDQLLVKNGEEARIVFYRLEEIGEATDNDPSVSLLIQRIRQKIGRFPGAVAAFDKKLGEAGVKSPHFSEFQDTGFRVLARMACRVDDRIPRVTRAMFGENAAKITKIEYSVDLSGVLEESQFQHTVDWFRQIQDGAP